MKNKPPVKKKSLSLQDKQFAKELVKNGGNGTKAATKIFKRKSYSANAVKANALLKDPKVLAEVQIIKERIADRIPDDLLVEKHLELLNVPRKVRKFVKGDLEYETEEVNEFAVKSGLDMAYKLKGSYATVKVKHSGAVLFGNMEELSNEELAALIAGGEDQAS